MTVSAQPLAFDYAANGVTTTFPYQCRILFEEQLKVYVDGVIQVGGYSVTNVGNQNGGDVVFSVAPANGSVVLIRRISDRVRTADFQQAPYFTQEELLDLDQDYQTMLVQEAAAEGDKSIRIPSEETVNTILPSASERAGKQITFGANGEVQLTNTAAAIAGADLVFAATKAAADSLAAGLGDGATVIVDRDETAGGVQTRRVVTSGVLGSPVNELDAGQVEFTQAVSGAVVRTSQDKMREFVSVKDFGAVGDGVADDTVAFQSALARIRPNGGSIYVPAGVYKVSSTLDFFVASPRGGRIFGDGHGATWIHWTGGAGTLFSNEQATANQFQYGFMFEDMTLATVAPGASIATPLAGSIGVHAEMLQKLWGMRNVSIVGFETNLDIGVHAEAGLFSKCQFAYGDTGVNAYGDQADCLVFHACWFTGNKTRGLILSSPRPVVDSCFFGPVLDFSDTANYSDIQIGWQAVRAGDIGKSSYLTAAAGNAAAKAKIINNAFEGDGSAPQIVIKNIDTDTKRFADLVFENNSFASYGRPCAIRIEKSYDAVTFRNNRMSKNSGSTASFLDVTAGTMGELVVDEPHITDIWPSQEQLWAYGASQEMFNDNPSIANSVMYQLPGGSWNVNNEGAAAGITLVDLDFDGNQNIKVTYGSLTGVPGVRIRHLNCPAGWVYVAFGVEQSSGALAINVDAKNGSGVTLFSRTTVPVSKDKRRVVFGFNNPTPQTIDIRVYPRPGTTSGSFVIAEPLIKHSDGSAQSQSLVDTKTGMRFTQRLNQIHDWSGRVPFVDLADFSNLATGRWFVGVLKQTTINNVGGYSSGATSIVVADGSKVAVGDYMYFKPVTGSGLSNIHRATATTGNKVSSVTGNTIGLATGLPYAVPDGGSVIACPVYQRSASTKI